MKSHSGWRAAFSLPLVSVFALGVLGAAGCSQNPSTPIKPTMKADLTFVFPPDDEDAGGPGDDGGMQGGPNNCGDNDPACHEETLGPGGGSPFPLGTDPMKDPNEKDDGVGRDPNGYLGLDQSHASFDFLYSANTGDWNSGTVTRIDTKTVREVARFFTYTCFSNPSGSKQQCDGNGNGCCVADDYARFMARKGGGQQPAKQSVQRLNNSPSRTAIDFNGDIFVSNRSFGGQSSLTKIANDLSSCKDRNKNGKIDTSSDVNADGVIQTDCNSNGKPDDIDDVKGAACSNGMRQEFYGEDDECILWTTNTNVPNQLGRPLGLGPGAVDFGPSDAWAGTFQDGKFFRIDGTTGLTKDVVQLPNGCMPYGLVVDSQGFGWAPNLSTGPLCFFNTKKVAEVNQARTPSFGQMSGYGVTLDRDQNIWIGGYGTPDAYRYTPDRTNGFPTLDKGWWVKITNAGRNNGGSGIGRGIAADSRTQNQYWVWVTDNNQHIIRLPGSDLNKMVQPKQDTVLDGSPFLTAKMTNSGYASIAGVGIDREQNVWGVMSAGQSGGGTGPMVSRAKIDMMGNITQPDLVSAPKGQNKCPAGDSCMFKDNNTTDPQPYTYSDFTGFGLRNFTRPAGTYTYVFKGCDMQSPKTDWYTVFWDADVPPNTSLSLRARTGRTQTPDQSWGAWTTAFTTSPADLITGNPLLPNDKDNYFLQVEFTFKTMDKNSTPKLKMIGVAFKCGNIG